LAQWFGARVSLWNLTEARVRLSALTYDIPFFPLKPEINRRSLLRVPLKKKCSGKSLTLKEKEQRIHRILRSTITKKKERRKRKTGYFFHGSERTLI